MLYIMIIMHLVIHDAIHNAVNVLYTMKYMKNTWCNVCTLLHNAFYYSHVAYSNMIIRPHLSVITMITLICTQAIRECGSTLCRDATETK